MPINSTSTTRLRALISSLMSVACLSSLILISSTTAHAQFLEKQLVAEGTASLAKAAKTDGDAKRGAVVFYQPYLSCAKCHIGNKEVNRLGPELAKIDMKTTDAQIVESILEPSKVINKEYQPIRVLLENGEDKIGLLDSETKTHLLLRDPGNGKLIKISKEELIHANYLSNRLCQLAK